MPNDVNSYSDIDIDFLDHPISGDISILTGEASVKQSLKNLILTNHYTKFYSPLYGGNIDSYLFEQNSEILKQILIDQISNLIEVYEKRVELIRMEVSMLLESHTIEISLFFEIVGLSQESQLNLVLERIR